MSGLMNYIKITTFAIALLLFVSGCEGDDEVSPPLAPSGLNAEALAESEVRLTWSDNSSNERGFHLMMAEGGDRVFHTVWTTQPNTREFIIGNLNAEGYYYFLVQAFNDGGTAQSPDTAFAATIDVPPAPPTVLSAQVKSGPAVWLHWEDNSEIEDGYLIYRSFQDSSGYNDPDSLAANRDTITYIDVEPDTTYYFRVAAFNEYGVSHVAQSHSVSTGGMILNLDLWIDEDLNDEIPLRTNLYIRGAVRNMVGVAQSGIRVDFRLEPDDIGNITRWSWTAGEGRWRQTVVFFGTSPGLATIIGKIDSTGNVAVYLDTVYVQVGSP